MEQVIPEEHVLVGTLMYLLNKGWDIESVSPATGEGLKPVGEQRQLIEFVMNAAERPIGSENFFRSDGPDVIAHRGGEVWTFECKGLGKGKPNTLKNHFDRAVASVMSYYDKSGTKLGLALHPLYLDKYGKKLPAALRMATNLHILLVEDKTTRLIEPEDPLDGG